MCSRWPPSLPISSGRPGASSALKRPPAKSSAKPPSSRSGRITRELSSAKISASEASNCPPTVAPYSQRWRARAAALRWLSISIWMWPMRLLPRNTSRSPRASWPWLRAGNAMSMKAAPCDASLTTTRTTSGDFMMAATTSRAATASRFQSSSGRLLASTSSLDSSSRCCAAAVTCGSRRPINRPPTINAGSNNPMLAPSAIATNSELDVFLLNGTSSVSRVERAVTGLMGDDALLGGYRRPVGQPEPHFDRSLTSCPQISPALTGSLQRRLTGAGLLALLFTRGPPAPEIEPALLGLDLVFGGRKDHRNVARQPLRLQPAADLDAVDAGHLDVERDQTRRAADTVEKRGKSARCTGHSLYRIIFSA